MPVVVLLADAITGGGITWFRMPLEVVARTQVHRRVDDYYSHEQDVLLLLLLTGVCRETSVIHQPLGRHTRTHLLPHITRDVI